MKGKCSTLLIAERGGELSHSLNFWITEQGHRLKAVDNLKDLLMTLQSEKISVLVMDVRLPENLGYEAISIIKDWTASCPSSLPRMKIIRSRKAASGIRGYFTIT